MRKGHKNSGSTARVSGWCERRLALLLVLVWMTSACVTVRPEQRAVLADPSMQYEENALEEGARQHMLENREATYGGGAVQGGGCGCN